MSDPLNAAGGPQRAFQQGRAGPGPGAGASIGPVQQPAPSDAAAPPSAAPSPFLPLPGAAAAAGSSAATISAAPQLRDLKKEATAFVPAAMRRKMAQQKATLAKAGLTSVDAARGAGGAGGAGETEGGEKKKSLVEEMRERGIGVAGVVGGGAGAGVAQQNREGGAKTDQGKEDYERFRAEMGEFL